MPFKYNLNMRLRGFRYIPHYQYVRARSMRQDDEIPIWLEHRRSRTRKGLSPLIATVLMIAFTLGFAGILTAWAESFTQNTVDQVGNESERLITCSTARIVVADIVTTDGDVSIILLNAGQDTFPGDDLTVTIRGATGSVYTTSVTDQLRTGAATSVTVDESELATAGVDNPESALVISQACPERAIETSIE